MEEPSASLRLRPNVKTEIEDETFAAAAALAAEDAIEISDEESDWNKLDSDPLTGPKPSTRPAGEIPSLWGVARQNRRRPTMDHHWMPPQITAYRTSAGVLLQQPVILQSLNQGQSVVTLYNVLVYSDHEAFLSKFQGCIGPILDSIHGLDLDSGLYGA